ncbi:YfiT family bacillithiol transferase [Flavobacterium enshiense]|uniref:YfiT family bacillithiol transferase n=1 Tax=Flavobacterium enshiense TaxID=1341165 RepID=UPI00345CF847
MKHHPDLKSLQFPIGQFVPPEEITPLHLEVWRETITNFPQQLGNISRALTQTELNWRYRPDGWKIKQVIHHLADSHMNALIRLKLALTEENPVIRPYEEALWAQLTDSESDNIEASLKIIEGIHSRWSQILKNATTQDWNRMYFHPQHQRFFTIKEFLGLYDWHCRHHFAHIQQALQHKGTFNSTL